MDAEFTTSNPLCPVTSYELTAASAAVNDFIEQPFFLTPSIDPDSPTATFTVTLDPAKDTLEDVYTYTITATAEGLASATVTQTMEVYDACVNTLVDGFEKTYSYFLPESTIVDNVVIASSAAYVEPPFSEGLGCTHRFEYVLTSGEANPDELKIDPDTGALSLETSYLRKQEYSLSIIITNIGGNQDTVDTITDIVISVVCGKDSTILTPPEIELLQKGNIYPDVLSHTKLFETSNALCPVVSYELTDGDVAYDFVDNGASSFTVTLNEVASPVVDVYYFTVKATAEGASESESATSSVTASMEVQKICITLPVTEFSKSFDRFLPEEDTTVETFPASYTTYVYEPEQPDGCT